MNPRLFYYDHKLLHISVPKSTNKNFIKEYEKYCIIAHIWTHTQNHVKLTGYKSQSHEGGYRFLCFYGHVMMFRYLLNFLAVSSASYYISLSRVCIILYAFPLSFSFRIRRWCIKSRVFSSLNANWRMKERWEKIV